MDLLSFIIWNGSPEIFSVHLPVIDKQITLRWYGLLFALGFLISQQILYYIYRKENKPESDVDKLTLYMVIATIIGARLGHVLFYEPDRYLKDPIKILKVWEGGLASHGAAFAILFALWLYARAKKPGQSWLQVVDRIVILVALTGALIRFGNFFNSEIVGKPTHSNSGVVFARNVTEVLKASDAVEDVAYVKVDSSFNEKSYPPVKMLVDFKDSGLSGQELNDQINNIKNYTQSREQIDYDSDFSSKLVKNDQGYYSSIVSMYMIPRHPAQLYESIACLILFAWLFWIWNRHREKLPPGRLLGIFLIYCFGLRFLFEFLKEPQVDFESTMTLNMGQLLSIPLVLAGIYILWLSYRKKDSTPV